MRCSSRAGSELTARCVDGSSVTIIGAKFMAKTDTCASFRIFGLHISSGKLMTFWSADSGGRWSNY